jgi:hypothetical protein
MMSSNSKEKEIYNIPGSGWKSPSWNWGYANGTGHDCALICRNKYNTRQSRQDLIQALLHPDASASASTSANLQSFEEVKLILGLTIQRGRWDGTDGGQNGGGYSEVLEQMANAKRYESNDEQLNAELFVQDMSERFHLIAGNVFVPQNAKHDDDHDDDASEKAYNENMEMMKEIQNDCQDYDIMRRKCTALVLQKMGFIELGM